jgi:hypothetical protein
MQTPTEIPKDLVAVSATPIILAILRQGESDGYAIIRRAGKISSDRAVHPGLPPGIRTAALCHLLDDGRDTGH